MIFYFKNYHFERELKRNSGKSQKSFDEFHLFIKFHFFVHAKKLNKIGGKKLYNYKNYKAKNIKI